MSNYPENVLHFSGVSQVLRRDPKQMPRATTVQNRELALSLALLSIPFSREAGPHFVVSIFRSLMMGFSLSCSARNALL
jgi:hypothetical protein